MNSNFVLPLILILGLFFLFIADELSYKKTPEEMFRSPTTSAQ